VNPVKGLHLESECLISLVVAFPANRGSSTIERQSRTINKGSTPNSGVKIWCLSSSSVSYS